MLMFAFHSSFILGLIALALGAMILVSAKQAGKGVVLAKIIAYLVILFAVLNILCTSYYSFKFWHMGYLDKACPMMQSDKGMQMPGMMKSDMMQ
jgi:hypothetical protein